MSIRSHLVNAGLAIGAAMGEIEDDDTGLEWNAMSVEPVDWPICVYLQRRRLYLKYTKQVDYPDDAALWTPAPSLNDEGWIDWKIIPPRTTDEVHILVPVWVKKTADRRMKVSLMYVYHDALWQNITAYMPLPALPR